MLNKRRYNEKKVNIAILGAGVSGLACSYFIGHDKAEIFERSKQPYGLLGSREVDGVQWDMGPHLSFTKHKLVRDLFQNLSENDFCEVNAVIGNYNNGSWLPHPVQSHLYSLPSIERDQYCAEMRFAIENYDKVKPSNNYAQWLQNIYGCKFTEDFISKYTQKYWTVPPSKLTADWIGTRFKPPTYDSLKRSMNKDDLSNSHYITKIRYPRTQGYMRFIKSLANDANVNFGSDITSINLKKKFFTTRSRTKIYFNRLISTIPLPEFINLCSAPSDVQKAAKRLSCSSALLINCVSGLKSELPYHLFYVYDENKLSTRVTNMGNLAPSNLLQYKSAFQVEVYESKYKQFGLSYDEIARKVSDELIEMGIVSHVANCHWRYIKYANVIFDHGYFKNIKIVLDWLSVFGLAREPQDTHPLTDWSENNSVDLGSLILAGRHSQWKYYWSDDCIMRANEISNKLKLINYEKNK